jgi:hypothetical protein
MAPSVQARSGTDGARCVTRSGSLGQLKCTAPAKWSSISVGSWSPTPLPEPRRFVYAPVPLRMFQVKVSAVMSLLTIRPRDYKPFGVKADLERMITEYWSISRDDARRSVAEFRTGEVNRWRDNNKIKAAYLQRGIALECSGIALLAASMTIILV